MYSILVDKNSRVKLSLTQACILAITVVVCRSVINYPITLSWCSSTSDVYITVCLYSLESIGLYSDTKTILPATVQVA